MSSLTPLQQAFLNAYAAACAEVPRDFRRSLILIGGAASIAHGMSDRKTKDADILVSSESLAFLEDAIVNRRGGFHKDTDGINKWDQRAPEGEYMFNVPVELILINGPFAPRIPDVVGFGDGCIATLPELVRFRAETFVARGNEEDYFDFRRLLPMTSQRGLKLPHIEEEELETMLEAVGMLKDGNLECIFMSILSTFTQGGRVWSSWEEWEYYYLLVAS